MFRSADQHNGIALMLRPLGFKGAEGAGHFALPRVPMLVSSSLPWLRQISVASIKLLR